MLIPRKAILLFIAIGCLFLTANVSAATLTAGVDRTKITMNDTLLLTITLNRQGADEIDFSVLALQFDILQRQKSSQASIINGRISAITQWTLIIAPKENGKLIIPSLSANGAFSDAISIDVGNSNNNAARAGNDKSNNNGKAGDVFLTASVNKESVYVQEQVLLKLQLHYRVSLSNYEPSELTIANSTQEYLDKKNYKTVINGVEYNVLELIYAVHPQASGTITIPVQRWQVEKPSNRFGLVKSPYIIVNSHALTVNVKPIATQSTADQWLPATAVQFSQEWQQSTITAKVGEPLSYQLRITAEGLSHSQLPNTALDNISNADFTIYSDKADTKNQLNLAGITGTRIINYAVIPKKAGTFALPPISLRWWNTVTDKEEMITLESQKIVVANTSLDQQQAIPNIPQPTQSHTINKTNNTHSLLWLWQLSTLLFIILSGALCYVWLKEKRRNSEYVFSPLAKGKSKRSSMGGSAKKRALNSIYKELDQAIAKQQWHTVKALILEWASAKSQYAVSNSDEFTNIFPDLAQAMQMIDKQLYSPAIVIWDFAELLVLLKQQQTPKTERNVDAGLENLYR
jgi:hypothetical protein